MTVTVGNTSWMVVGMPIFIETAGNFTVVTVVSSTTVRLRSQTATGNAASGTTIASGKKVITGAVMTPNSSVTDSLSDRITSLESTPQGNRSWYSTTAPSAVTNTLRIGDIWFDTDDGYKMYRWDGSGWVDVQRILQQADFGTGIRPIVKVTSLPTTGYSDGDFVWLQTDGKLYRRVGGQWTKALSGGDLVGQVDGALIVDGTIIAQKLGANSVTADKVGANQIITTAANIGNAVITDAHISTLSAGKISAGDIQSVNIGYADGIFHPSYIKNEYAGRYFRSTEFGTSFADNFTFAAGTAFTFTQPTPVTAYGPGNASWRIGNAPAMCPDSGGNLLVQMQGRLIGYQGSILLYCRINGGSPIPLASEYSEAGGASVQRATIDASRKLTGLSPTSRVEIYVAPANANGDVAANVTCRYEVDAIFFNW
ncbi:MAG: hypothetical protein ACO3DI_00545 [Ilumatobacteraceae bacterium]